MKNILFRLFKVLIGVVLFGKVLNWLLHFNEHVNQLLNTAMFCLIGLAYVVVGFAWDKKIISIVILGCGFFLLTMNFLPRNTLMDIIGIVSIVTPMLIARFIKNEPTKPAVTNAPEGTT